MSKRRFILLNQFGNVSVNNSCDEWDTGEEEILFLYPV